MRDFSSVCQSAARLRANPQAITANTACKIADEQRIRSAIVV